MVIKLKLTTLRYNLKTKIMKKPFNFETHCHITGFKKTKKLDEDQYLRTKRIYEEKSTNKSPLK